jgi:hypothetical protein
MTRAEADTRAPSLQLEHPSAFDLPPGIAHETPCAARSEPVNAVRSGRGAIPPMARGACTGGSAETGLKLEVVPESIEFLEPSLTAMHQPRAHSLTTEDGYISPMEDDKDDEMEDDVESIPRIPDTWFLRHQHLVRWQSLAIPFSCLTVLQILGS